MTVLPFRVVTLCQKPQASFGKGKSASRIQSSYLKALQSRKAFSGKRIPCNRFASSCNQNSPLASFISNFVGWRFHHELRLA